MFKNFFYGLKWTILKSMILTSVVPFFIVIIGIYIFIKGSILTQITQTMTNSLKSIERVCHIQSEEIDEPLEKKIHYGYRIAVKEFAPYKRIDISKKTKEITVKNQATGEKSKIKLPIMYSGNTKFLKYYKTVDTIVNKIGVPGATSTVFQLFDDKLIRIATNVKTKEGKRAILTYIPKDSLVYRTIISGKPYMGRAIVVGKWTITHYEPLRSRKGDIIGVLYVGVPAPETAIFDIINENRIGERGYTFVINSQGQIISHPHKKKGKNIGEVIDLDSDESIDWTDKEIEQGNFTYIDVNQDGDDEEYIAYFKKYKKWDWVIISTVEKKDILQTINEIFIVVIILIIVFPIILIITSTIVSTKISEPFKKIIDAASRVSNGDLTVFIPQSHYKKCVDMKDCTKEDCVAYDTRNLACWRIDDTLCVDKDGNPIPDNEVERLAHCKECKIYKNAIRGETDELIDAINHLIVTMMSVVEPIKTTVDELKDSAEILAETSEKMENESTTQAAIIEETTSSNEELMATIENVANVAERQSDRMAQTSASMEQLNASTKLIGVNSSNVSTETQKTVDEAKNTETMLKTTTESINQIAASSEKIEHIVAIINDISDQINLLSLNAAIEAARAGEHGKGFAVVSEEISKLADATAQSTKEIEQVISKSRTDVQTGTNLINKTTEAITSMIKKIEGAASLITEIASSSEEQVAGSEQVMKDVEDVNIMSTQIANATSEQKLTSTEILKALTGINSSIQELAGSSQNISQSADTLKEKSKTLKEIISIFKTEK